MEGSTKEDHKIESKMKKPLSREIRREHKLKRRVWLNDWGGSFCSEGFLTTLATKRSSLVRKRPFLAQTANLDSWPWPRLWKIGRSERGDESGRASTWKARKVNWKSFLLQKATKTYFTAKHSRCSSCCFHLMSFPWAGVKIEDVFGILKRVVLAQGHSVETIFSVPLNLKPPSLVQKFLLKPLFCKNIDTS